VTFLPLRRDADGATCRAAAAATLLAALAGCDAKGAERATWIELADCELSVRPSSALAGEWHRHELDDAHWTRVPGSTHWLTQNPSLDGELLVSSSIPPRLVRDGEQLRFVDLGSTEPGEAELVADAFGLRGNQIVVDSGDGSAPEDVVLEQHVGAQRWEDERPRVELQSLASDGVVLRAPAEATFRVDLPPESGLTFACAALRGGSGEAPRPDGAVELSLEVDGEVLWTSEPAAAPPRPNVLVFLADTFRADNLRLYGGSERITPCLDRFADEALRFRRAWSPATSTLPAHGSLFLARYPYQHGATAHGRAPSDELVGVAERLAAAGYRTGAVTDSGFVSHAYGMDRGFAWFREHDERSLEDTLASVRGFLDADDGRPFFLFVHSYYVHAPYSMSDETFAAHGERLGVRMRGARLRALMMDAFVRFLRDPADPEHDPERVKLWDAFQSEAEFELLERLSAVVSEREDSPFGSIDFPEQFRALYHGAVIDLDAAFGAVLAALELRGLADDTYVVFTSDHGELFGEHRRMSHGPGAWEELLRIPLLIRGPGVEPGDVTTAASLVDLPHTLAEMAGVSPLPGWEGESLLSVEPDGDRPAFGFDCAPPSRPHQLVALIDGDWKLVLPTHGEVPAAADLLAAYHLARDPDESEDRAAQERARLLPVAEQLLRTAAPLFAPAAAPADVHRMGAAKQVLQELGYAGD